MDDTTGLYQTSTAKHWAKVNDVEIAFAALHSKGNLVLRLNKKHSNNTPSR